MTSNNKEQWSTKTFGFQPTEQRGYQPTQSKNNSNGNGNGTNKSQKVSDGVIAQSK